MQFGKSLLGAIVGAAVGVGLLLLVYLTLGLDKSWLSIPFAILTGLGVRMFASTSGHASYVRGAMTMAVALAAYIGGWFLVAKVASAHANSASSRPAAAAENKAATEPGEAAGTKDATPKDVEPAPQAHLRGGEGAIGRGALPKAGQSYSAVDIICLAIAALVAYEMGRGSGMAPMPTDRPAEPAPAGTQPNA